MSIQSIKISTLRAHCFLKYKSYSCLNPKTLSAYSMSWRAAITTTLSKKYAIATFKSTSINTRKSQKKLQ